MVEATKIVDRKIRNSLQQRGPVHLCQLRGVVSEISGRVPSYAPKGHNTPVSCGIKDRKLHSKRQYVACELVTGHTLEINNLDPDSTTR